MPQLAPVHLPQTVQVGDAALTLRLMTAEDAGRMLAFARSLPSNDLLFLRRDITRPEEIADWVNDIEAGSNRTVLALEGDAVVGYSTVARTNLRWMAHVAELRVLVAEKHRRGGLGRLLIGAAFRAAVDMGVEKMMAQMTVDQEGAIGVFYRLGFEEEARLRNHVKDRDGKLYDLIVLSQDVSEYQAMRHEHEGDAATSD
jgi:L-amino acid N-acyltransferase YncA